MRTRSLKKTLPKMTGMILVLFLFLILPLNFWLQLHLLHQSQRESTKEMFGQLEQLIGTTEEELASEEEEFKQRCIRAADMTAYHMEHTDEDIRDLDSIRELAGKMNVDEIHFFTPQGEIFAGTHPQYYGYTMDSGEQMHFFSPMLQDRSLKLCQDIMPNTAEGKEMQYAAVWLEDGSCIVQIGMKPWRLRQKMEEKSLENIVGGMLFEMDGYLHVLDAETGAVAASTSKGLIGETIPREERTTREDGVSRVFHVSFQGDRYCVYTKPYKNYILVRTYRSRFLLRDTLESTVFVIMYVLIGGFGIIGLIRWYVQRRLIRSLDGIIGELQKIETGNLENINIRTGITEFEELLFYINQMLNSVRSNRKQLRYILDKAEIPFGFFEKNNFYNQSYANNRMIEILGIGDDDTRPPEKRCARIEERLMQAEKNPVSDQESIYQYSRQGEERYLNIKKAENAQGVICYVTDVTHLWKNASRARQQSQRDDLTGLYNRRGLYDQMNLLFGEPSALGYAAMLMIDADGLKRINDQYGHFTGDQYLKRIAAALRGGAGEGAVCARLGGDEFVVLLHGFSGMKELKDRICRIGNQRGTMAADCRQTLQFSMGAAFYPGDGADPHVLMQAADERMYREKKSRKLEGGASELHGDPNKK